MYKYLLESVENINWLAATSLVLFVLIFLVSSIWILTRKKQYIEHMENMPLEEE